MHGGVGGAEPRGSPLSRSIVFFAAHRVGITSKLNPCFSARHLETPMEQGRGEARCPSLCRFSDAGMTMSVDWGQS